MMNVTKGSELERSTKNTSVSSKNASLISWSISHMTNSGFTGSNLMSAVSSTKSTSPAISLRSVLVNARLQIERDGERECVCVCV